jgi:hypothetical protein
MLGAPIEEVVACPEFAATLDELQGPHSAQGVVEIATIRFVAGSRSDLFLVQCGGIGLRESLEDESLCFSQPARQ